MDKIYLVEIEDADMEIMVEQFAYASTIGAARQALRCLASRYICQMPRPEIVRYLPEEPEYEAATPGGLNLSREIALGELVEVKLRYPPELTEGMRLFTPFTAYIKTLEVLP